MYNRIVIVENTNVQLLIISSSKYYACVFSTNTIHYYIKSANISIFIFGT